MYFNSYVFIIFFFVVYISYRFLKHRWQNILLLVASYIFYGWWDYRFLSLIFLSTLVDYYCGRKIKESYDSKRRKRVFLFFSVFFNLGLLGIFKYCNFFIESLQSCLLGGGFEASHWHLNIVLPVGISFYTFQTMSYTIDIYRGKLKPTNNFFDFALFVSFFPQLVAGPIERASHFLPQVVQKRIITREHIRMGLSLIVWGYFKKVFVADNMAVLVNEIFGMDAGQLNFWWVALGGYAFALQIYGDFSGYSDIARGLCKLMGFDLMVNFRSPYFVTNIAQFWRHWHISLSSWLRDYLYIPLGGNRLGAIRTKINLAITMILGGLWHGAAWNFVWWGIYQGGLLMFVSKKKDDKEANTARWKTVLKWAGVCQLTVLGWIIFRSRGSVPLADGTQLMSSSEQLIIMFRGLFVFAGFSKILLLRYVGLIFFGWMAIWEQYDKLGHDGEVAFVNRSKWFRTIIWIYLIFSIVFMATQTKQEFIYFQF